MSILRWILAFPVAIASWLFFPMICEDVFSHGLEPSAVPAAVIAFLNPVISLGMLVFILPPGSQSNLIKSIVTLSIICAIGTLIVSFLILLGGGSDPIEVLIFEIAGVIVGAGLAYACASLKCRGISK